MKCVAMAVGSFCVACLSLAAQDAKKEAWTDHVKVRGDLRYRYESIDDASKDYTRERERIRVRIGLEAQVNDNATAGVELSTGGAAPASGSQTLTDGFQKKEFRLSQGWLSYCFVDQKDGQKVSVTGGKMKQPWMTPGDLMWDAEVNPEGLSGQYVAKMDPVTLTMLAGSFWLKERERDSDDTKMNVGHVAAKMAIGKSSHLLVGGTYYGCDRIKGADVFDWEGKNNSHGNSTVNGSVSGSTTNKAYKYDFNMIETFIECQFPVGNLPVRPYAQGVVNDAAGKYDTGYLVGVACGKAKEPGTWEAGYYYCEVEKDALLGEYTETNRWGGGTDGRGHKVCLKYQVVANVLGSVSYFITEKNISDSAKTSDYDRLQIQVDFVF